MADDVVTKPGRRRRPEKTGSHTPLSMYPSRMLASAALALAAPARAINGGVPDYDDHPNVGVIAFDIDGDGPTPPYADCTGSVISDHAFLTAAHCIDAPFVPPGSQWAVTLAPGTPSDPIMPGGYYPDDFPDCCVLTDESQIVRATEAVVDPDYDPDTGMHDLAVAVFPAETFTVAPVGLPFIGLLDELNPHGQREGPQFTVVGYGTVFQDDGYYVPGYRKRVRISFCDLSDNWLYLSPDGLPHNGDFDYGDSGSPQFLGGTNIVVSVGHTGAVSCDVSAQRFDTTAEQAFLAPYLY